MTKTELASYWSNAIDAAERAKKAWSNRFIVDTLYQYYEGFQYEDQNRTDERDVSPYIINLIYSTIESKLPNMLFSNPKYFVKPQPLGEQWNEQEASQKARTVQDALNFVINRKTFNLLDKYELATLDAFFGFGVIHTDYNSEISSNPYLPVSGKRNPLDNLYAKHIPFNRFYVSARANWDLSEGGWFGYYEFVPEERLDKYAGKIKLKQRAAYMSDEAEADQFIGSGKISLGECKQEITPSGTYKVWYIWDFRRMTYFKACFESVEGEDRILEAETFEHCGISTLRYGKRLKGWYPLPPVFNWISPQDEVNDVHQAMRMHRKRFKRKYAVKDSGVDPEELDKFLYGPDGTTFVVKGNANEVIKAVEDPPLDASNQASLVVGYDDFNRVAGSTTEQGRIQDRTTASQAVINDRRAQVRESRDQVRLGNFLVNIGESVIKSLRKAEGPFWIGIAQTSESFLAAVGTLVTQWKRVAPMMFEDDDITLDLTVTSISPIYSEQDKKGFMEFLALITQYEMISFSPALMREAADKVGYRNEAVLGQMQQWAQLMAIGRQTQLQAATGNSPQPTEPGTLPEQQVNSSTPSGNQDIMNAIFNKQGVQ